MHTCDHELNISYTWYNNLLMLLISPPPPTAVTCPELPGLTNGLVVVSTRTAGSRAVYVCNSGYAVLGVIARLCGDDGRWTEEEPVCISESTPHTFYALILAICFPAQLF